MTARISNIKKPIMASWLRDIGCRLDARPFVSGALEARKTLEDLPVRKESLEALTIGYAGGIFNGPQFGRTYVDAPEHGVPFVGSSDMLAADLTGLPLLRKTDAYSQKLRHLELKHGMTLISCSGTIGRTVYARSDMDGVWSSQHIMKVVPDPSRVPPGYLFAFISSRFGIPIVVSGTYGSIIQSIGPQHIAKLPVPRLGSVIEQEVHALVDEAASLRSLAAAKVAAATKLLEESAGLSILIRPTVAYPYGINVISSREVRSRLDAFFHSPFHAEAISGLHGAGPVVSVANASNAVVEPIRFKRIPTTSPQLGVPFFGTSAIMNVDPEPSYLLVRAHSLVQQCIVGEATVLVPRSGQLSGIIGMAVLPYGPLIGGAVTEDAIRIHCDNEIDAGFVFIALTSEYGRRQLKARSFGSSIPHLDVRNIREILLPDVDEDVRRRVGRMGSESARLRGVAIEKERQARAFVEDTIVRMGDR